MTDNEQAIQSLEIDLLRSMSIQDRLQQWRQLQSAFEWQIQQTADLFAKDRYKALAELQMRLRTLQD